MQIKSYWQFAVLLAISTFLPFTVEADSILGMTRGMTLSQLQGLADLSPGKEKNQWVVEGSMVPKGTDYMRLTVCPEEGLLQVFLAFDVETNSYGDELRSKFESLHKGNEQEVRSGYLT